MPCYLYLGIKYFVAILFSGKGAKMAFLMLKVAEPWTRPSVWGWYTEVLSCFTLSRVHRSAICQDMKGVPWSVSISAGMSTLLQSRKCSWAMDLAGAFRRSSSHCSLTNEPPPVICGYRSRKRLGRCWGDSPSLPLSEASKTGHWRAPLIGLFLRRLPLGLTGCKVAACRRSNPSQSLPRRTGTGRSLTTPTSTGQALGPAKIITLRSTKVIGRKAVVSPRGVRT